MTMTIDEYLGNELRKIRQEKDLSQEQAAEALGVKSKNSVSLIEQGKQKMTVAILISYCQYLGVDYIKLLEKARDFDISQK